MYLNSKIYKVYSILVLVFTVIGLLVSLFSGLAPLGKIEKLIPGASDIFTIFRAILIFLSLLSLFFSYVEFSSMYAFGDMIEHEQSNSSHPMIKKSFIASPKFYRSFGSAIFIIYFITAILSSIILIISASVSKQYFIALPVIPLVGIVVSVILIYITYQAKYSAVGDLLEVTTSPEVDNALKDRLSENKPRLLRGYCTFLFVMAILSLIAVVFIVIFAFSYIESLFGTVFAVSLTVGLIIYEAILFVSAAITGCYYDNLGKMLEHYLIKYKLI